MEFALIIEAFKAKHSNILLSYDIEEKYDSFRVTFYGTNGSVPFYISKDELGSCETKLEFFLGPLKELP